MKGVLRINCVSHSYLNIMFNTLRPESSIPFQVRGNLLIEVNHYEATGMS